NIGWSSACRIFIAIPIRQLRNRRRKARHAVSGVGALLPSLSYRARRGRQSKSELVAATGDRIDPDHAAQLRDDALHGGKAEAMPGRALLMQPREGEEYAPAFLFGQRLAVVAHPEADLGTVGRAAQLEPRRRAAILECVAQ